MDCLYFTDGLIKEQTTFTNLCLLFDKVHTFYIEPDYYLEPLEKRWETEKLKPQYQKMPVEIQIRNITKSHAEHIESFMNSNQYLIDSDVLKPIIATNPPPDWGGLEHLDKILEKDQYGLFQTMWAMEFGLVPRDKENFYVDAPYYSYHRIVSTMVGFQIAVSNGLVPITDDQNLNKICILTLSRNLDRAIIPSEDEIVSILAMKSLSLLVPNLPALKPDDILEVREKLSESLSAFRYELHKLATEYMGSDTDALENVVKDRIQNRLDDLELQLKSFKGRLFRKITNAIAIGAPVILSTYNLSLPLSATFSAVAVLGTKISNSLHEYRSDRNSELTKSDNRWLSFLLEMKKI